eukprot:GHVN01020524.1.p1 GENE.GHVN01020524.1~~GHVN01020524.1.p1  ORF type:complete len:1349 (-),score=245.67 GHVN01020524.1:481-4269(-)
MAIEDSKSRQMRAFHIMNERLGGRRATQVREAVRDAMLPRTNSSHRAQSTSRPSRSTPRPPGSARVPPSAHLGFADGAVVSCAQSRSLSVSPSVVKAHQLTSRSLLDLNDGQPLFYTPISRSSAQSLALPSPRAEGSPTSPEPTPASNLNRSRCNTPPPSSIHLAITSPRGTEKVNAIAERCKGREGTDSGIGEAEKEAAVLSSRSRSSTHRRSLLLGPRIPAAADHRGTMGGIKSPLCLLPDLSRSVDAMLLPLPRTSSWTSEIDRFSLALKTEARSVENFACRVAPKSDDKGMRKYGELIVACKEGNEIKVKAVIYGMERRSFKIGQAGPFGWTVLHSACYHGCAHLVSVLLGFLPQQQQTHIINSPSLSGFTPLIIASYKGNIGALNLLIERGANVHATDNRGNTSLHVALNDQVQHLLICSGADSNAMNHSEQRPVLPLVLTKLRQRFTRCAIASRGAASRITQFNRGVDMFLQSPLLGGQSPTQQTPLFSFPALTTLTGGSLSRPVGSTPGGTSTPPPHTPPNVSPRGNICRSPHSPLSSSNLVPAEVVDHTKGLVLLPQHVYLSEWARPSLVEDVALPQQPSYCVYMSPASVSGSVSKDVFSIPVRGGGVVKSLVGAGPISCLLESDGVNLSEEEMHQKVEFEVLINYSARGVLGACVANKTELLRSVVCVTVDRVILFTINRPPVKDLDGVDAMSEGPSETGGENELRLAWTAPLEDIEEVLVAEMSKNVCVLKIRDKHDLILETHERRAFIATLGTAYRTKSHRLDISDSLAAKRPSLISRDGLNSQDFGDRDKNKKRELSEVCEEEGARDGEGEGDARRRIDEMSSGLTLPRPRPGGDTIDQAAKAGFPLYVEKGSVIALIDHLRTPIATMAILSSTSVMFLPFAGQSLLIALPICHFGFVGMCRNPPVAISDPLANRRKNEHSCAAGAGIAASLGVPVSRVQESIRQPSGRGSSGRDLSHRSERVWHAGGASECTWWDRFVMLTEDGWCMWCRHPNDTDPIDLIHLSSVVQLRLFELLPTTPHQLYRRGESPQSAHCFSIDFCPESRPSSLFLHAETKDERDRWVDALHEVRQRAIRDAVAKVPIILTPPYTANGDTHNPNSPHLTEAPLTAEVGVCTPFDWRWFHNHFHDNNIRGGDRDRQNGPRHRRHEAPVPPHDPTLKIPPFNGNHHYYTPHLSRTASPRTTDHVGSPANPSPRTIPVKRGGARRSDVSTTRVAYIEGASFELGIQGTGPHHVGGRPRRHVGLPRQRR